MDMEIYTSLPLRYEVAENLLGTAVLSQMHYCDFWAAANDAICPPFRALWVRVVHSVEVDDWPKILCRRCSIEYVVRQVVGYLRRSEGVVYVFVGFRGL